MRSNSLTPKSIKPSNQCIRILKQQSIFQIDDWLQKHKIGSYSIRNQKAIEIINISNYIFSKMLVNHQNVPYMFVEYLLEHYKTSNKKFQFCRILRHFAQKDYQFDYILSIAQMKIYLQQSDIGLYMRVRQKVAGGFINKHKRQLLSAVQAQIQQWYKVGKQIFKGTDQARLIGLFTEVVKQHYVSIKKDQSSNLNGVEFFRICQLISQKLQKLEDFSQVSKKTQQLKSQKQIKRLFDQSTLNGLKNEDKQLIRVLAYKDKNIARLLEEKHNNMIKTIAEQVDQLRRNMQKQQKQHIKLIQQKNTLIRRTQSIKTAVIELLDDRTLQNEAKVLSLLEKFSLQNNISNKDINETRKKLRNKRLIQLIQKQQLQSD